MFVCYCVYYFVQLTVLSFPELPGAPAVCIDCCFPIACTIASEVSKNTASNQVVLVYWLLLEVIGHNLAYLPLKHSLAIVPEPLWFASLTNEQRERKSCGRQQDGSFLVFVLCVSPQVRQ